MTKPTEQTETRPDIAVYYFPSWHADRRYGEWFGEGWTEWELVKRARPRFSGHRQPLKPLWGYADESQPDVMARSCDTAAAHGVDAFLFDWYWYEESDFLNVPLDHTYLELTDVPVKFALMWANHDWVNVFPARVGHELELMLPTAINRDQFRHMTDRIIDKYMTDTRYWRVDGGAYFSIFKPDLFIDWMGGTSATRDVLDDFRDRARRRGAGDLHLCVMDHMPLDAAGQAQIRDIGMDSVTSYNWGKDLPIDQGLSVPYRKWRDIARAKWEPRMATFPVPFRPNVSMGWDSTARVDQGDELELSEWPFLPVVVDNTPDEFEASVRDALALVQPVPTARYITVNAWNEWTEGSYLEPDTEHGMAYLEALRAAAEDGGPVRPA